MNFFSGGRRKKLKRPQMKTCTDRPVKKEAQNDDDHRRTWRSVFKVGNATTTTTTFKKKFISVAATPKIQQNVKLCKFYANFWLQIFFKNRQN